MQQLRTRLPWLQPEAERGREVTAYHNGKSEHQATVQAWREATHHDITDRFGRVWVWHHGDTYLHDGISCPKKFIRDKDMQLPNRKLRGNPNYAGLCEICTSEW